MISEARVDQNPLAYLKVLRPEMKLLQTCR